MEEKLFYTADEEDVINGLITDVYFARTKEILKARKNRKRVKAEFIVKNFPGGYKWGVLAGIEEAAGLMQKLNVRASSMDEGTVFGINQPVLVIEGRYIDFAVYETPILGLLCQASGIATKAARCKKAAGPRPVVSFGARRMHPTLAPMIDRNAYLGGCDGVAVVKSAELLDLPPTGTIPHALILLEGDPVKATRDFHKIIDPKVKRIALVDTFGDEKFEALKVAQALGDNLYAVRLDTPSSRRGDFLQILQEVRWELNLRGHKKVKLFVSGGIDEYKITELNPAVDAYGVGTSICNAPVLDFAMDIVEIEGKPIAKRGKFSGGKSVFRCTKCRNTIVVPQKSARKTKCSCGGKYESLIKPLVDKGKLKRGLPSPKEIRTYVLDQLKPAEL